MHQNMAIGSNSRIYDVEYTVYVAKTRKAPISFAVTAKLICAYVLAYAKSRFSNAVQLSLSIHLLANLLHCGSLNAHK